MTTPRHTPRRRRFAATATATLAFAAIASPAFAHAQFEEKVVPAETEMDLTFKAPQEEPSTNARIEALAPRQFTILDCTAPDAWTCEIDTASEAPDTVIVWEAGPDALLLEQSFLFHVRTPLNSEQGVYSWPVLQTYANGTEAAWIGDTAPVIQVGDSTDPVVQNEDAGQAHTEPSSQPETTEAPAEPAPAASPSSAPASQDAPAESASTNSTDATPPVAGETTDSSDQDSTPASTDAGTGSTPTTTAANGPDASPDAELAASEGSQEGGRPTGMIIAVIGLAVVGGGAFAARGRFSS